MGKHHVIYVPGLGDDRTYGQDIAIQLWRLFGLKPHYFPLKWADKQAFEPKLTCMISKINELKASGCQVYLVGVSAGASATLNAYAITDKVDGVVWLCGKIHNPQIVRQRVYDKNPAFRESMAAVPGSLKRLNRSKLSRIMSIHPLADESVPPDDTKVAGTLEKTIRSTGHARSIFYAVVFCGPSISRFLRLPS